MSLYVVHVENVVPESTKELVHRFFLTLLELLGHDSRDEATVQSCLVLTYIDG